MTEVTEKHVRIVKRQAWRLAQFDNSIEHDLVSAGLEALCQAAIQFKPNNGYKTFEQYANQKTRNAMIDFLRTLPESWGHRHDPKTKEPIKKPRLKRVGFHNASLSISPKQEIKAEKIALTKAINQLKPREQEIIKLYFWQDQTMVEVGNKLGITESRVSQIFNQTLKRLRRRLVP